MDQPLAAAPRSLLEQAAALLSSGQAQLALKTAALGMARFPHNADLANLAGVCAATLGNPDEAEQYWRQSIALNPNSARPHLNLGLLNANLKRGDRAEHHYRLAIAIDPGNATVYANLGALLADGKRLDEAERCYRLAIAIDPGSATVHSNLGVLLANRQRHDDAEGYYRRAIALDAANIVALTNLGNLLARGERHDESEQCYRKAIALNPKHAAAYANLGQLLSSRKRDAEAEECYRAVIALDPRNAETHFKLGVILANRKQYGEAERFYHKTVEIDPSHAMAHSNLGVTLAERKQNDRAEQCYRKAITLDPGYAMAYSNLGVLLANNARNDEAERCYGRTLALDPGHAMAHSNLGTLLARRKRHAEAEHHYRLAIALENCCAPAHTNLGLLLEDLQRYGEAEKSYLRAIASAPDAAMPYSNLGLFLTRAWRDEEAEQRFRQAIAADPNFAIAHFNLGFLLLRQGRFSEGWPYFEARNDPGLPDENRHPCPITAPFPQWQGEPLAGKSLLVWPEQGLGDEIQFCRYLPLLKRQGAARITLVCKAPLKPLMETLEGVDKVIALGAPDTVVNVHDYWIYPLSIPLRCKTTLATIPARLPYLRAPPDRVTRWSARLPRDGFRVGLVWKGSPTHSNDGNRSLPGLAALAPLWSVPGVRFVSLQKGQGEDEARTPPAGQPLMDLGAEIDDFADTAAIVEQLDLVISVDTSVAHVAGALARPSWVLLPAAKVDWRWLRSRTDSPWYPGAMRLFRQREGDDWAALIMEVRRALVHEITGRRAPG
jgi:tetratricopeptide (TPR) repeat protein